MTASRALFLPEVIWPLTPDGYVGLDRTRDEAAWLHWVGQDVPVVTQWDDGEHVGRDPGRVATSSSSMPSLVSAMLDDLDVRPGHRVLDLGTGTGWTAALLTERAGQGHVVSVDVDPAVVEAAASRLRTAGYEVALVAGDGAEGWSGGCPYDRVQVTYAVTGIQRAWIDQTRVGGLIVVPWRTRFTHHGAVARLTVRPDGSACGSFTRPAEFMQSRGERLTWPDHHRYLPPGIARWPEGTTETTTDLPVGEVWDGGTAEFVVGAIVPDLVRTSVPHDDGHLTWLYSLSDLSWAAMFSDPDGTEIYQHGPRRLWDEVEKAWHWWADAHRPEVTEFGLTITSERTLLWLHDESEVVSVLR